MPIRSMTGFAQVKGQLAGVQGNTQVSFTVSMKSVNHRFLDLQFRMPAESESLEMKLRRLIKDRLARGHVEFSLRMDGGGARIGRFDERPVDGTVQARHVAAEAV